MLVSVVICTYGEELYDDLEEAARSIFEQTYDDVELVIVVDGTEPVYERAVDAFGDRDDIILHCNESNCGLAASRNRGAELATGEIVAFMDDDAVADDQWIENLVCAYKKDNSRPAVGGKMVPNWVVGQPEFLPEEFYWLIGVTHRGFASGEGEVRNTNGSNLSFRRDVFLDLGGFDTSLGIEGEGQLQAEEPELCARMRKEYGHGVWYVPEAKVAHKIFDYRTAPMWLAKRAFWQGYSKRGMEAIIPNSKGEEKDFLRQILFEFIPGRIHSLLTNPSMVRLKQLVALLCLLGCVAFGYLYGVIKWAGVAER